MHIDYCTIDRKSLDAAGLPRYDNAAAFAAAYPRLHLSDSLGAACFMDAPGYPSYFLRSVYTRKGDTPDSGPALVLDLGSLGLYVVEWADWQPGDTWEGRQARLTALFRSIWAPLPLNHERTRAWVYSCYAYFARTWLPESRATDAQALLSPGKNRAAYTDQFQARYLAPRLGLDVPPVEDEEAGAALLLQVNRLMYRPFTYVKEFYPEFAGYEMPEGQEPWQVAWHWGKGGPGDWWERYDTPAGCDHPNGAALRGWCQLCGYVYPEPGQDQG